MLGLGATASPSPSISAPAIDMDRTKSATLLDDEPMMIENGKKKRKRKVSRRLGRINMATKHGFLSLNVKGFYLIVLCRVFGCENMSTFSHDLSWENQ